MIEVKKNKTKLESFCKQIFILMDKDHNGTIDQHEFSTFIKNIAKLTMQDQPNKEKINMAFKFIDIK